MSGPRYLLINYTQSSVEDSPNKLAVVDENRESRTCQPLSLHKPRVETLLKKLMRKQIRIRLPAI